MRRPLAALVAAAALSLTACGTDADVTSQPPAISETAGTEPATSETNEPAPTAPATPTGASNDDSGQVASGDCSAAGLDLDHVEAQPELPAEVDDMRRFLIDAALRCDEQALHTAANESEQFTYSFGESGDLVGFLRTQETEHDEPVYAYLAQLLNTTPALADGGEVWVWPRVTTGRPQDTTEEAWAELEPIFGEEAVAQMRTGADGQYLNWRVGISTDGEWRFFVAGD